MTAFRGHLSQNENNTYTINARVIEAQVNVVAGIPLSAGGLPRVVSIDAGLGVSSNKINKIVPKIKISDITDLSTLPPLAVTLVPGVLDEVIQVCNNGLLGFFDTSSFVLNQPVFLGINGQIVTVRPKEDRVIQIGSIGNVDALFGTININIQDYPNPEPYYGGISVNANVIVTAMPINNTNYQVLIFDTDEVSSSTTPDFSQGHVEINKDGVYEVSCAITSTAGGQKNFMFQIFANNGTVAFDNLVSSERVVQNNDPSTITLSGQITLNDLDTIELWTKSSNGTTVIISECSLVVNRIGPIP